MILPSTFSIVACDLTIPAWGVAVASKFPAVGAVVPWVQSEIGAIATQSYANTAYGPKGLKLLEEGNSAQETLTQLLAKDQQRNQRQVGIVDMNGVAATYTGEKCHDWAGGVSGEGYAIQGNILVGKGVVEAMEDAYVNNSNDQFLWRMFNALYAGDQSGGDRRGKQSAAIYIAKPKGGYGEFNDRWVDYRVDDHQDPVARLGELLELHELYFEESETSDQIELSGEPLIKLQAVMIKQGFYAGDTHGIYDKDSRSALETFIGYENFEDRTDFDAARLDKPVYEYILKRFGDR